MEGCAAATQHICRSPDVLPDVRNMREQFGVRACLCLRVSDAPLPALLPTQFRVCDASLGAVVLCVIRHESCKLCRHI